MRGMWQSTGRRRRTHCSCSARQHRRSRRITAQKQGKYPVFALTERFLGAGLPEVIISDMRGLAREGRSGIIGPDLERELISTLEKGKQAILFLNRRGNSRVIRLRRVRLGARVPVLFDHHDLPFGVRPRDVPLLRRFHQDNRQVPACGSTSLFTETPARRSWRRSCTSGFRPHGCSAWTRTP